MQDFIKIPLLPLLSYILLTIVLWDTRGLFVSKTALPIPTILLILLLIIQVYSFWIKRNVSFDKAIWACFIVEFLLHIISIFEEERSLNNFAKVTQYDSVFSFFIIAVILFVVCVLFAFKNNSKLLFLALLMALFANLFLVKTSIEPHIDTYTYVKKADQLLLKFKNPYLYKFEDMYQGEYNHIYGTSFCFNYLPLVVYITTVFEFLFNEIRFAYVFFNFLFCLLIIKSRKLLNLTLNSSMLLSILWLINPVQMFISERAFIDSLVPFLIFSMILLLFKKKNFMSAISLGLLAALKLYYIFLMAFVCFYWLRFFGFKRTIQYGLVSISVITITILPFIIDNYQVFYFNVYVVYSNIGTRIDSLSIVSYCAKKGVNIAMIGQKIGMSILLFLSSWIYLKKMEMQNILTIINIAYLVLFLLMRQAFANYFYFNLVIFFIIILVNNITKNSKLAQIGTLENSPSM